MKKIYQIVLKLAKLIIFVRKWPRIICLNDYQKYFNVFYHFLFIKSIFTTKYECARHLWSRKIKKKIFSANVFVFVAENLFVVKICFFEFYLTTFWTFTKNWFLRKTATQILNYLSWILWQNLFSFFFWKILDIL